MIDWKQLLTHWSVWLMGSDLASRVDPPPTSPDWLGFPPATDADIAELEARLGLKLPPSYVAFLKVSNGWRRTTFAIDRLRPAAEVDWFRVENENWAETFGEYDDDRPDAEFYVYENGSAPSHRAAHTKSLVQISDVDDGVYLLNPKAVTPDGEWEAWFFANWVPGAVRYPSFAHLMVSELDSLIDAENGPASRSRPAPLALPSPALKRKSAKKVAKLKAAKAPPLSMDELIPVLDSPDKSVRGRALRMMHGKIGLRGRGRRRPDLVKPLSELFARSDDAEVRAVCVSALTELAEDGDAPAPLFAALTDPDPNVVLNGIWALHYFPDPGAVGPLCQFVESRVNVLYNENAMSALADLGDPAAVPTLVGVLLDTPATFDQSFGSAGIALGRIRSPEAVEALIAALDHADARVRVAAVVGLDVSGDPRATALLDRMADDPDESVRRRAKHRMGRWQYDQ